MEVIKNWFRQTFADGQLLVLLLLLMVAILGTTLFGNMMAPAIAAVVIAFLLDGPIGFLVRRGVRPILALVGVFSLFLMLAAIIITAVIPPLLEQIVGFFNDVPTMVEQVRQAMLALRQDMPQLVSEDDLQLWFTSLGNEIALQGPNLLAISVSGVTGAVALVVYLVLVPLMVFFFLRDKREILSWCASWLPSDRPILNQVWQEITARIGDYARGKVYQILIITSLSFIVFQIIGLRYATLLSVATGLSVILPFIGAAAVTFPVALVALLQWGWGQDMGTALIAYAAIQAFDGNILNPLLFSNVMKLHPNAIILAILFFGGVWGFWGLFFAIPLATVANAIIRAWRDHSALVQSTAPYQKVNHSETAVR